MAERNKKARKKDTSSLGSFFRLLSFLILVLIKARRGQACVVARVSDAGFLRTRPVERWQRNRRFMSVIVRRVCRAIPDTTSVHKNNEERLAQFLLQKNAECLDIQKLTRQHLGVVSRMCPSISVSVEAADVRT